MVQDIISSLSKKDLNEFKKDFTELMRANSGINEEYSKLGKQIDQYITKFKEIVNLFNKKYKSLSIKISKTTEELKLIILIKEKSVRDVFTNVASKLNGLKSIGSTESTIVPIEDANKFSRELDRLNAQIFISYHQPESGSITFSLEEYSKKMVELHYGEEISDEKSPEFKLCAYYAVNGGIKEIDIIEQLNSFGFLEFPLQDKIKKFLRKFNPRIEE